MLKMVKAGWWRDQDRIELRKINGYWIPYTKDGTCLEFPGMRMFRRTMEETYGIVIRLLCTTGIEREDHVLKFDHDRKNVIRIAKRWNPRTYRYDRVED